MADELRDGGGSASAKSHGSSKMDAGMTATDFLATSDLDNSDQDDEVKMLNPDHAEERFRVDRRKLEHMIKAHCDNMDEDGAADDFFHKIMEDTNTRITWPSKLKIGAKSKKDPHIKVAGNKLAVANAREKIMAVLDTKSSRVTLKMDVSHTEHSHVIGKGGNNIKQVMQETSCHIHFPDSNRNTQAEKSNQVSIAGQPRGVEQARQKIRELLPLVLMFELPAPRLLQALPDVTSPQIQQIQNTYGVTISFKQRSQMYMTTVIVRGSVCNRKSVKDATLVVIEHLTGNVGISIPVSMQLDIAPQHHLFIIGRGGANIKQIMQLTGATIHFPDPSNSPLQRKGTVFITGSIDSVLLARQQLIGCLPMVLMFDMKEDADIEQAQINQLMEQLDVYISIKPKAKQPSKSVIVKTIERNIANVYEARRRLLGLTNESPIIPPPSPSRFVNGNQSPANIMYHSMMTLAPPSGFTPIPPTAYSFYQNNVPKEFDNHNVPKPDAVKLSLSPKPAMVSAPKMPEPIEAVPRLPQARRSIIKPAVMNKTDIRQHVKEQRFSEPEVTHQISALPRDSPNLDHTDVRGLVTGVSNSEPVNWQRAGVGNAEATTLNMAGVGRTEVTAHNLAGINSAEITARTLTNVGTEVSSLTLAGVGDSEPTAVSSSQTVSNASNTLALLSNVMSMSLLDSSQPLGAKETSIANVTFTKNDLKDAVSSLQSQQFLHQFGPSNSLENGSLSLDLFQNAFSDMGQVMNDFSSVNSPGTVVDGNTRRQVQAPPGFHNTHREQTEMPQTKAFPPYLEGSQSLFENKMLDQAHGGIGAPDSPLMDSNSPHRFNGALAAHKMNSALGGMVSESSKGVPPLRSNGSRIGCPSSPICRKNHRHFQNADKRPSEPPVCDSAECSDLRAPGCNRPKKFIYEPFTPESSTFSTFDYEKKKLLATKAMQKKPEGESRIPTDFWSGLGFSKSLPDSAIRERLKSTNVKYDGPSMTPKYESNRDDKKYDTWGETIAEEEEPVYGDTLSSTEDAGKGKTSPSDIASSSNGGSHRMDGSDLSSSPPEWSNKPDLAELFSNLGLGKYTDLFTQQEIDLGTFLTLTDKDLKELGISTFGARRKMLIAIADLNKLQMTNPVGEESNLMHNLQRHDIASQSGRW